MATLIVCNWHCECSACGWGTDQGFYKVAPAPPGSGGTYTFFDPPDTDLKPADGWPAAIGMDDTHCPRCGEEFDGEERLYTS